MDFPLGLIWNFTTQSCSEHSSETRFPLSLGVRTETGQGWKEKWRSSSVGLFTKPTESNGHRLTYCCQHHSLEPRASAARPSQNWTQNTIRNLYTQPLFKYCHKPSSQNKTKNLSIQHPVNDISGP